jgi:hypothetical protein
MSDFKGISMKRGAERCGVCGRFVNHIYPVCSSWHDELAGDIIKLEERGANG